MWPVYVGAGLKPAPTTCPMPASPLIEPSDAHLGGRGVAYLPLPNVAFAALDALDGGDLAHVVRKVRHNGA